MEKIYYNLTGIDIRRQKEIWDERGRGYYGEFLVLKELYKSIPGVCKILMNLQIPVLGGKTTEIDLLMIHETGLYVFEIKHHKGHIYGKDDDIYWTQYFRTTPNQTFINPVKQNEYHIAALKALFPNIPISSIVVFTNDECSLHLENNNPNVTICRLAKMISMIKHLCESRIDKYGVEQIDEMFKRLLYYAPEVNTFINTDGQTVGFYQYLETLGREFKAEVKKHKMDADETVRKMRKKYIICAMCATLLCTGVCIHNTNKMQASEKAISDFAQKFEHVQELEYGELVFTDNLVKVSDVILADSKDLFNTVNFSCMLTGTGENYGIIVGKNVMINVILHDGTVKEYDLWNERYPYQNDIHLGNLFQPSGKIGLHEFPNLNVSDVSYIKLTNLGIWSKNNYPIEAVANGYEIELYDYQKGTKE